MVINPTFKTVKGMNNRTRDNDVPKGYVRNAVNVIISDSGEVEFTRPGKTPVYTGNVLWYFEAPFIKLFVEDGDLKRLNADFTATTLLAAVGNDRMTYTVVGSSVYFSNWIAQGKVANGAVSEWGVTRPARQPDCTAVDNGGLFAGDYRVAITFIAGSESGTGAGRRVTVVEGGGIHLSNFPAAPGNVTLIAVYVSPVNSRDMYLYGEYPATVADVFIGQRELTVPLTTQFKYPPKPVDIIQAHYGRIYYAVGKYLYWTFDRRYDLQRPYDYWEFDSNVVTVESCPNVLYVQTQHKFYKIVNIDGDGAPIVEELQNSGATKGSVCVDPDGVSSYFMSARGLIKATPEGLAELTYKDVAIPLFGEGATTVIERNGTKYLVFSGKGGTQNPLADSGYSAGELVRGSL